ncbi:hypothetical protein P0D88_47450 [Paraburkholderia sp. RL18-103-BIB-C]|uniref:hypothetical protein n=1 Tax=unclassified Paraburkholderia TaxID=2615204 RepID=UPI0038B8F407
MTISTLYTSTEIAARLLPDADDWTARHVATAVEELAAWRVQRHQLSAKIDRKAVVKEVREMNMSIDSCDRIVAQLEQVFFVCEWTMPNFDAALAGFQLTTLLKLDLSKSVS